MAKKQIVNLHQTLKLKNMNPPVIIFAYNRPQHLKRLVESLSTNEECRDTDLIIYADGAKTPGDKDVEEVKSTIQKINGFKSVTPIFRPKNMGLASNIIDGVSKTIHEFGTAVVLEDDLVATPHLMRYMKQALDHYKDSDIFSIAAYTPQVTLPDGYAYDTYPMMRNCSWGWATWSDRWDMVDWDVKDFDTFFADDTAVKDFNKTGNDLSTMLLKQRQGIIQSWSIRFCYAAFRLQKPTIYPVRSLVTNGGADGSGTNVGKTSKYNTATFEGLEEIRFCDDKEPAPQTLQSFRRTYDTSLQRRIINYIKRTAWLARHK